MHCNDRDQTKMLGSNSTAKNMDFNESIKREENTTLTRLWRKNLLINPYTFLYFIAWKAKTIFCTWYLSETYCHLLSMFKIIFNIVSCSSKNCKLLFKFNFSLKTITTTPPPPAHTHTKTLFLQYFTQQKECHCER